MRHLSAVALAEWLSNARRQAPQLLDVREPWEYALCRLPDAVSMPMQSVPARIGELDRQTDIVVIYHHGVRSLQVAHFLEWQGFVAVHNLSGGIDAWANDVDPLMRKY